MKLTTLIRGLLVTFIATSAFAAMETKQTRIGTLEFKKGYRVSQRHALPDPEQTETR